MQDLLPIAKGKSSWLSLLFPIQDRNYLPDELGHHMCNVYSPNVLVLTLSTSRIHT